MDEAYRCWEPKVSVGFLETIKEVADGTREGIKETSDASRVIIKENADGTRAGIKETADASRMGLKETSDGTRFVLKEVCDASRDGISATTSEGRAGVAATTDSTWKVSKDVRDEGRSVHAAVHEVDEAVCELGKLVSGEARFLSKAIADMNVEIAEASAEGQLTTERAANGLRNAVDASFANTQNLLINGFKDGRYDAAANTASIQLEAAKNASAIALAQCTNTAAIQLEAAKNAAAAALASCQNTAAILAAQEKCCCELKELVRAEGASGRDLQRAIESSRQESELRDAKAEVFYLKSRVPPGTPV